MMVGSGSHCIEPACIRSSHFHLQESRFAHHSIGSPPENVPVAEIQSFAEMQAMMSRTDMSRSIDRWLVTLGAILGGLAVALGALGAHALKHRLNAESLGWWQTAVQFQMWHALALLALGFSGLAWVRTSAWLLAPGVLIFSGTLYLLALGGPHWLGAVAPLGGVAMISGWALLAYRAATHSR